MTTETYLQKHERLVAELEAARAARDAYYEPAWRAKYAELKARDKAEARKRTVAQRRAVAMDSIMVYDPEYRKLSDAAEAAYVALKRHHP